MNDKTSKVYISMRNCITQKSRRADFGGHVKVNGKKAILGDKVTAADKVVVNGKRIVLPKTRRRYIMLNKPRGFITTMNDERGRKCVAELVQGVGERVYPVGRLDKDSEGMLILTTTVSSQIKLCTPRTAYIRFTG